jgi:hypothetical protein
VSVAAATALVLGAASLMSLRGSVDQPLAFSHTKHTEDLGLPCTTCHLYAETGMRATIPNIEVCRMCHTAPLTESEEEVRLVEFIEAGEPIPWSKVYWVEDHVYFSHRRHTSVAGIECETCHGEVKSMAVPVSKPAVKITMDRCMECHWTLGASNDCDSCHR